VKERGFTKKPEQKMANVGTVSELYKVVEVAGQGKSVFATQALEEGTTLLVEAPLVSAQFAWNKTCKYLACGQCMTSMETPAAMAARLSAQPSVELVRSDCFVVDQTNHTACDKCSTVYCRQECKQAAWDQHHQLLCTGGNPDHPLALLQTSWKEIHPPPETTSVELLSRFLAMVALGKHGTIVHSGIHAFALFEALPCV
jgi:hypothetical protein